MGRPSCMYARWSHPEGTVLHNQLESTHMVVSENTSKTLPRHLWEPSILTQPPGNTQPWTAPPGKPHLQGCSCCCMRRGTQPRQEESTFSERKELQSPPPQQLPLLVPPLTGTSAPRLNFSAIYGQTTNRIRMSVAFIVFDGHTVLLLVFTARCTTPRYGTVDIQ